jgi:SAM-dependent methyltransferase
LGGWDLECGDLVAAFGFLGYSTLNSHLPKLQQVAALQNAAMTSACLDLRILDRFRRAAPAGIGERSASRRFPARLNRYLISASYLFDEAQRRGQALRICEIGISRGLMPRFVAEAVQFYGLAQAKIVQQWIGVDHDLSRLYHAECYDHLEQLDVERQPIPAGCDVYILLHVLEHLRDPGAVMQNLREVAATGALIIIGVPSQPHFLNGLWEWAIRRRPNENGHVSAFSRTRLLSLLAKLDLRIEDERAGYVLRASGLRLEDFAWWQSWNLSLGQRFPGFPGEYLVCARKS